MYLGKHKEIDIPEIISCFTFEYFITKAKNGDEFFLRQIAGMEAMEEAVGRSTEMGKSVLFVPGISGLDQIDTISGLVILGYVSEMTAAFVIPDVPDVLPQTVSLKKIASSREVWFCRYSLSTPPIKGQKLIVSIVGKDTRNQNIPPSTNVFAF